MASAIIDIDDSDIKTNMNSNSINEENKTHLLD